MTLEQANKTFMKQHRSALKKIRHSIAYWSNRSWCLNSSNMALLPTLLVVLWTVETDQSGLVKGHREVTQCTNDYWVLTPTLSLCLLFQTTETPICSWKQKISAASWIPVSEVCANVHRHKQREKQSLGSLNHSHPCLWHCYSIRLQFTVWL